MTLNIEYRQFSELTGLEMIWVLALLAMALWHSFKFFKNYRDYKIIKNKPVIPIASSHAGYIKVSGEIASEDTESTPFNDTPCCYWVSVVEGHWSEEEEDADGKTETVHHSETIYHKMADTDWVMIADETGCINFSTDGEIQNLSINKSTVYHPSAELKNILYDSELSKYDYLEITEWWLNEGESATAVGQMVSERHNEETYLFLVPSKKKNLPYFLTAMDENQLNKTQSGLFKKNLVWIPIALIFILDTFYLDSILIMYILAIITYLIIQAFDLISQVWNMIF